MCDVFGPPFYPRPYQKYTVYRKRPYVYVFGIDKVDQEFSILSILNTTKNELELLDGEEKFSLRDKDFRLRELGGADGSLVEVATASGIVGFVRFLQGWYLLLITKHKKCGKVGHHEVLCIEDTLLLPLFSDSLKSDEKKFKQMFDNHLKSKDFYFSYSYELSRTVQVNMADALRAREAGPAMHPLYTEKDPLKHHRFVWNYYLMGPFLKWEGWQRWCLPIIHGFFYHTKCSSFSWAIEITLIARRSRLYAGTRYRKRGLNVDGHVANEVETEQLVCDDSTRQLSQGHVTSFVQIRGSVPLFWSQEATAINPKPPVVYPRCDPTLSATRLHFADLFERYGMPLLVVNLMKSKKVDSDEVRLSKHFVSAMERMNRELPLSIRIMYRPFDLKYQSKSVGIRDTFARVAESVVSRVGFFHTQHGSCGMPEQLQTGVVRTNCVDCLDRTNALQLVVGREVLEHQLCALGLLPEPKLDGDSPVVQALTEIYDLMGDHVALQYAGSIAHKKYHLLGFRPRMMPTSKEIFTSISRHYSNSFNDAEKQAQINLFLGIYQPLVHPRPWNHESDSWVHHKVLRDNYAPGEWWDKPLRIHDERMAPLRQAADAHSPRSALMLLPEDVRRWFQVVHRVWKFTWFERQLDRLEHSFLQIHTSNRPQQPHRLTAGGGTGTAGAGQGGNGSGRPLSATAAMVLAASGRRRELRPGRVDQPDLHAYQLYADWQHQLSRLRCMPIPTDITEDTCDLSRVHLFMRPLPPATDVVIQQDPQPDLYRGPSDDDKAYLAQELLRESVSKRVARELQRAKTRAEFERGERLDRAEKTAGKDTWAQTAPRNELAAEFSWITKLYEGPSATEEEMDELANLAANANTIGGSTRGGLSLPAVSAGLSPLKPKTGASYAPWPPEAALSKPAPSLPRTASAPTLSTGLGPDAPKYLRPCSYCEKLSPDTKFVQDEGRYLCPEHCQRAEELAEFMKPGPGGGGLRFRGQTNEEARSKPVNLQPRPSRARCPWDVDTEPAFAEPVALPQAALASSSAPAPRSLPRGAALVDSIGAMQASAAGAMAAASTRESGVAAFVGDDVMGVPVSDTTDTAAILAGQVTACAPFIGATSSASSTAGPPQSGHAGAAAPSAGCASDGAGGLPQAAVAGGVMRTVSGFVGQRCGPGEDALRKLLWSYAFPHEPPRGAKVEQLGLPTWWLQTLEQPEPPAQDPTVLPFCKRDDAESIAEGAKKGGKPKSKRTMPSMKSGVSSVAGSACGNTPGGQQGSLAASGTATPIARASDANTLSPKSVVSRMSTGIWGSTTAAATSVTSVIPAYRHTAGTPSVFHSERMAKVFDEILGCASAAAPCSPRTISGGGGSKRFMGHSRARSTA